ncbi:hypothetical protein SLEP1_g18136 [Rubroshorea leprosula]|uniref:Heme O synthase n=1 Tax=Rubroshorea leprosula TaxID=152421 RepID=A0AAV5IWH7_9ROSI|nr:hypothetical protein SLEP1_g18136 [Rubroshorea leprosula]
MWRSSAISSFYSKFTSFYNPSYYYATSPSIFTVDGVVRPVFSTSQHQCIRSFSSSAAPSPSSLTKLGFLNDGIDAIQPLASKALEIARHYGRCYWELSKARLSMLVVATSGTGYVLGSGNGIDFAGLCWTCAGTMMVAASANSLNQVFEIKNDAKMKRTRRRPLPSGRITAKHAVIWASSVGLAGTAILAFKANMLAAGLATSNLILYAFAYTPLKQIHPVNTWVGAIVGAIPPLLGWAAASGQVSLNGMILPAALYFWQIPHFMALAYLCRNDYAAGGYRMFSLADPSGQRTAAVALRNCLYLVPLGFIAYDWGLASGWFCLESTFITLSISATAFSFYHDRTTRTARRMFYASLLYLPVFMSGLLFHRISDSQQLFANGSNMVDEHSPSSENIVEAAEGADWKNEGGQSTTELQARPPVAYASAAPFPFLPAPSMQHLDVF